MVGLFALLAAFAYLQVEGRADLSDHFQGYDGCFVLQDLSSGQVERFKPARAAQRLSPCSTFKIANALIGLETGVVSGPDHLVKWDGRDRGLPQWNQDHTLQTAIRDSAVWYFQMMAREVGPERMGAWLAKLDYGNQDIAGGIDQFWLRSSLEISADEQVAFLSKLYSSALPCQPQNLAAVRQMLVLDQTPARTLSGKTGSGVSGAHGVLGWFVGHVQRGDKSFAFACNIQAANNATGRKAREIAESVLREKGLM